MKTSILPINRQLANQTRASSLVLPTPKATQALAWLVGFGVLSAVLSVCVEFSLRIPGHAILRAVFPMAAGLAFVPRRGGGTVMGLSAMVSALVLSSAGYRSGAGALASLALVGPCLDVCLHRATRGWRLYGSFIAAGFTCNLIAFFVRTAAKLGGLDAVGTRPLSSWLKPALLSYMICGAIAGFVSASVWFRFSPSRKHSVTRTDDS